MILLMLLIVKKNLFGVNQHNDAVGYFMTPKANRLVGDEALNDYYL